MYMFHVHESLLEVTVFSAAVLLQFWQQCEVPVGQQVTRSRTDYCVCMALESGRVVAIIDTSSGYNSLSF